jgi:DNA-binding transcriptional MerR regulator
MFTIGDFAKYGRVSVRMLRHSDAIGLLPPARVDAASGYRYYDAAQLARLNRVVALKDLGLRLDAIRSILDEQVSVEQLRGMLRCAGQSWKASAGGFAARAGEPGRLGDRAPGTGCPGGRVETRPPGRLTPSVSLSGTAERTRRR